MTQPLVFVAYSQQDEAEKEQLLAHLNVLGQAGRLDLWSEDRIGPGTDREAAIRAAIADTQVAILLLSANFFNAGELVDSVLPQLRARQDHNKLTLIPVLAKACAWNAVDWLARLEIFPIDQRPVWGGDDGRADEQLARLASQLAETLGLPLEQVAASEFLAEGPAPGESPYKGLQYFNVADAGLFFGREQLTAKLVQRLKEHRFLAIVGASGSGKSSLVRAGLLAALRRGKPLADGKIPPKDSPTWAYHLITPTAQPLKELAASLTRDSESVRATSVLMDDLADDRRSLDLAVHRVLSQSSAPRLLLLVDQFEELFTLCKDESQRRAFVDNLLTAVAGRAGPTTIVVALRADFYAHCGQYEQLRLTLENQQVYIGPMNQDELRLAIEKPAQQGDWHFESGLVDLLLADVDAEPGALPLLSHALLETWKRRRGRMMTTAGYIEAGRVQGAIAHTADLVFQELKPEQQGIARSIFLRLTELGEGTQDTRRRVEFGELTPNDEAVPEVETVLRTLADARLVTTAANSAEVAHEALVREWPLLRQWLDENRQALRLHRRLTDRAQAWTQLDRDPGGLLRGAQLVEVEEWAAQHRGEMNPLERDFLEASLALREQEAAERAAQRQRELQAAEAEARAQEQTKVASRLRQRATIIAAVALLAVVGLVLAAVGWNTAASNARQAEDERERAVDAQATALSAATAESQAKETAIAAQETAIANANLVGTAQAREQEITGRILRSQTLAAQAQATSGDERLLLAIESLRVTQEAGLPALPSARQALLDALDFRRGIPSFTPRYVTTIMGRPGSAGMYAASLIYSPDGRWLYGNTSQAGIRRWEVCPPESTLCNQEPGAFGEAIAAADPGQVDGSVVFSADGHWVAGTSQDDAQVRIWQLEPERPVIAPHIELALEDPATTVLSLSPDGRWLVTKAPSGTTIQLWDLQAADPAASPITPPGHPVEVRAAAFSYDNALLATAGTDGRLQLWDVTQKNELAEITLEAVRDPRSLAFSPDDRWLAAGRNLLSVDIASAPQTLNDPEHKPRVDVVAFSPDSQWLVTTGLSDGTPQRVSTHLWDLTAADPSADPIILPHRDYSGSQQSISVRAATFNSDGRWLATSIQNPGTVLLWPIQPEDLIALGCQVAGRNFTQAEWDTYFPGESQAETCQE